jgi:uncharacterized membrane protein YccC
MALMTAAQQEQKVRVPYFGAVYFGGFAAILGTVAALAGGPEFGFVAIVGSLFACTGLIQRTIWREMRD